MCIFLLDKYKVLILIKHYIRFHDGIKWLASVRFNNLLIKKTSWYFNSNWNWFGDFDTSSSFLVKFIISTYDDIFILKTYNMLPSTITDFKTQLWSFRLLNSLKVSGKNLKKHHVVDDIKDSYKKFVLDGLKPFRL